MVLKGFELFARTNMFAICIYKMGGGFFLFVGFLFCLFVIWFGVFWFVLLR